MAGEFERLAEKYQVVGAQAGLLRLTGPDGAAAVELATTGILNTESGAPVIDQALFQIGSITKVWTTCVALQLADEGRLDLDAPVHDALPEFALAGPECGVTTRHLLSHTSGIPGDLFNDTGRGDDALRRFVAGLRQVSPLHPPGDGFSYSNSAFAVAGRLIEVLCECTWDDAIRDRIIKPLGLRHTATLPEQVLLHAAAAGHVMAEDGAVTRANVWGIPRSMGPAGGVSATVRDLLSFATIFLREDTTVLSPSAIRAMRRPHKPWGLGWALDRWGEVEVLQHDGSTPGQSAFLRVFPALGCAAALLCTGPEADGLAREFFTGIANRLNIPGPPTFTPLPGTCAAPETGTYVNGESSVRIDLDGDAFVATLTSPFPIAGATGRLRSRLEAIRPGLYTASHPQKHGGEPVRFSADHLMWGLRRFNKVLA
ncbi:serine hydrolase domain-containing protein [Amycolatopsis pithecellobii]|uniref:serine hydrolase domain-containing protein n=1 Tax=Amycolatopsis pithecellobii TaxID=664692 RepID=UPI00140AE81D|nr:serine hydrolase domain-containing protein [Amycolatopsis pithecellobii]